jgi:hypothetical protein
VKITLVSASPADLELTTVLRGPSGAGTRLCIELAELMARPRPAEQ